MSDKELKLAEMKARKDQAWDAYHAAHRLSQETAAAWEDAHAEYETALRRVDAEWRAAEKKHQSALKEKPATDPVNHPTHYTAHPSGVECIQVTEHMGFCLGNAVKYIWRADLKANALEDLRKARWYLNREIERREKQA